MEGDITKLFLKEAINGKAIALVRIPASKAPPEWIIFEERLFQKKSGNDYVLTSTSVIAIRDDATPSYTA